MRPTAEFPELKEQYLLLALCPTGASAVPCLHNLRGPVPVSGAHHHWPLTKVLHCPRVSRPRDSSVHSACFLQGSTSLDGWVPPSGYCSPQTESPQMLSFCLHLCEPQQSAFLPLTFLLYLRCALPLPSLIRRKSGHCLGTFRAANFVSLCNNKLNAWHYTVCFFVFVSLSFVFKDFRKVGGPQMNFRLLNLGSSLSSHYITHSLPGNS